MYKISAEIKAKTHPDRTAAIIIWRFPAQFAALGGDVGHLKGTLWPCGTTENAQLDPFLVEPVAVLGAHLVLARVPAQRVRALEHRVVVRVGDLDPLVGLVDQELLLLGDVALPLGPGLVGDRLPDDIDRPGHRLPNLDRDDLQVVADKPWLH